MKFIGIVFTAIFLSGSALAAPCTAKITHYTMKGVKARVDGKKKKITPEVMKSIAEAQNYQVVGETEQADFQIMFYRPTCDNSETILKIGCLQPIHVAVYRNVFNDATNTARLIWERGFSFDTFANGVEARCTN